VYRPLVAAVLDVWMSQISYEYGLEYMHFEAPYLVDICPEFRSRYDAAKAGEVTASLRPSTTIAGRRLKGNSKGGASGGAAAGDSASVVDEGAQQSLTPENFIGPLMVWALTSAVAIAVHITLSAPKAVAEVAADPHSQAELSKAMAGLRRAAALAPNRVLVSMPPTSASRRTSDSSVEGAAAGLEVMSSTPVNTVTEPSPLRTSEEGGTMHPVPVEVQQAWLESQMSRAPPASAAEKGVNADDLAQIRSQLDQMGLQLTQLLDQSSGHAAAGVSSPT